MRRPISVLSIVVLGIVMSFGFIGHKASAANQNPQGLTVSPAFQQVSIPSTSAQQPIKFSVTNDKTVPQTINLSVADFNTLDETGGLFFVGANPTQLEKKYGLAKWIKLPFDNITLAPKQTASINAQILNLPDLAPGGHYGALMLAIDNGSGSLSRNNISVHPVASSLLFVTKIGGDTHLLSLQGVTYSKNVFSLPSTVTLRFQNVGNTHLIPRGIASITDSKGNVVSRGIINEDSSIILPQTFRRYIVPLTQIKPAHSFGKYKLVVTYRFDGYDQYRSFESTINLFPLLQIIIIAIICLLIGALAFSRKFRTRIRKLIDRQ